MSCECDRSAIVIFHPEGGSTVRLEENGPELLERFRQFCARRNVVLQPYQRSVAEFILNHDTMCTFLAQGMGSGRTFLVEQLEQFFDQERRRQLSEA